jgi:hypothetical protein
LYLSTSLLDSFGVDCFGSDKMDRAALVAVPLVVRFTKAAFGHEDVYGSMAALSSDHAAR